MGIGRDENQLRLTKSVKQANQYEPDIWANGWASHNLANYLCDFGEFWGTNAPLYVTCMQEVIASIKQRVILYRDNL